MKKTQWIVLLRDIQKTWVSFLSIIVFVALGVAIFLGIKWNEPALGRAIDNYLDKKQYHDLQLTFPYGFSDEEVSAVAKLDGVAAVEGAYNAYGTIQIQGEYYILNIQSLTDTMDIAVAVEGTLPVAEDEVAVDALFANKMGWHLGDKLCISASRNNKSYLKNSKFTITAFVEHPSFIRSESDYSRGYCNIGDGSADGFVLMTKTAFDTETYDGCYSQLLVRGTGLDELESFESSYQKQVGVLKKEIESLGAQKAILRSDGLYDRADEQITDAEKQLAQKQQELLDGKQQYTDSEKILSDGRKKIDDGERQLEENEKKLVSAKQEYADGEKKLTDGRQQIADAENQIAKNEKKLADAKQEYADGEKQLSDGRQQIADGENQIAQNEKRLADAKLQYADGEKQLSDGGQQIAEGEKQITENEVKLSDAKQQYQNGLVAYDNSTKQLQEGLATLQAELEKSGYSIDIDTAETQLQADKEKAATVEDLLMRTQTQVGIYNNDPDSIDEREVVQIAFDTFKFLGIPVEECIVNTAKDFQNSIDKAKAYLSNYGMNDSVTYALNRLLPWLGLSPDQNGVNGLNARLDVVRERTDDYVNDPAKEFGKRVRFTLTVMIMIGIDPDLSDTAGMLAMAKSRVDAMVAQLDTGLNGIAEYRTGVNALASGEVQLEALRCQIEEGEQKLSDAKKKLEQAQNEYHAGAVQLEELHCQIEDGEQKLSDAKQKLKQAKSEYTVGVQQLSQAKSEIEEGEQKLRDAKQKLRQAQSDYTIGVQQLSQAKSEIEEGEQKLRDAKQKVAQAKYEYTVGVQKLEQAKRDIKNGEQTLNENIELLSEAREQLKEFVRYNKWTVQIRTDNASVSMAKFYAQSSHRLCYSMAILFVFVGVMVCFTSITRSVNESQTSIGMQKALGFCRGEILKRYMVYSLIAAIIGILLGYALGYFVVESIVNNVYRKQYIVGEISNVYSIADALSIAVVEIALIVVATWLPCRRLLKRPAVELMQENNRIGGHTRFYENWRIWRHMSIYAQTIVNNLMNDGARVIAMMVGIIGCTALVAMSLSVRSSIANTPTRHFEDVWTYDVSVVSDTSVSGGQEALSEVLDQLGVAHTSVRREAIYIQDESTISKVTLIVPENAENLTNFIRLNDWRTGEALTLTDDGVIVSRTYAKHHGVKVGDVLRLLDTSGSYHNCEVSGISQHYLSNMQIVMSRAYYQKLMGEPAQDNTLYLRCGNVDINALQRKLKATNGYFSMTNEREMWTAKFDEVSSSTMLVIYIGLTLSVTMALLVLLNLNIVCVIEKTNELTIMRINGFSVHAVKRYIYNDNIVLTVFGIVFGMGVGLLLGLWVLTVLERNGDNFYRIPTVTDCLITAGLAAVFSLVTNLIALQRIDKLSVFDLNRL